MSNYSPFKAAIAALHTPEAIAYYKLRSEQDVQSVVIATVKIGAALYETAVMAYNLGVFVRALYEASKPALEVTAIVLAQPAAIVTTDEVIDVEIVESAPILFLSAAPQVTVTSGAAINQAWITANITPLAPVKALPAAKTKKAPTVSKAKKAPKPRAAGIAGRKAPTSVRAKAAGIATID